MNATVIGGGLAGCEAAWALAERGVRVRLVEMRPHVRTPAHQTDQLAELVCSNTFKSTEITNAHGLLKAELRLLGSLLLECADAARVPGGSALAVDRVDFARRATEKVSGHSNIEIVREEARELPEAGVVATGPLTSEALSAAIRAALGAEALAFYDAIAPIVHVDSLDMSRLFRASRYGKGTEVTNGTEATEVTEGEVTEGAEVAKGDYLNAPMTRDEYQAFISALTQADQHQTPHAFDKDTPYFEGCLPVEEMAARGPETLRFGPMKPVGLPDPRTSREAYAVVQLRQEDRAGQMWNLVGFQTRLRIPEQQRVFRMIPGLEQADFLRYGSIHRNAYLDTPRTLSAHLGLKDRPRTLFAGQITGVEGYTESLGTGLLAGHNLARMLTGKQPLVPPPTTMLGALLRYLREADPKHFQPMNANFGLLEPLEGGAEGHGGRGAGEGGAGGQRGRGAGMSKQRKKELLVERAVEEMTRFALELAT